jgi:hypothetical protein
MLCVCVFSSHVACPCADYVWKSVYLMKMQHLRDSTSPYLRQREQKLVQEGKTEWHSMFSSLHSKASAILKQHMDCTRKCDRTVLLEQKRQEEQLQMRLRRRRQRTAAGVAMVAPPDHQLQQNSSSSSNDSQ